MFVYSSNIKAHAGRPHEWIPHKRRLIPGIPAFFLRIAVPQRMHPSDITSTAESRLIDPDFSICDNIEW